MGVVRPGVKLTTIIVSIDPATTSGEDSNETGIVVVGRGSDGHGYVLEDASAIYSVAGAEWARKAASGGLPFLVGLGSRGESALSPGFAGDSRGYFPRSRRFAGFCRREASAGVIPLRMKKKSTATKVFGNNLENPT
jgi:hypothetical protein